jgi:hypothetical protein
VTTDALVKAFIDAMSDHTISVAEAVDAFEKYSPHIVHSTEDVTVWSLALNYDTRDVRFVKMDAGQGTVSEVRPRTVMHTEYERI